MNLSLKFDSLQKEAYRGAEYGLTDHRMGVQTKTWTIQR